MVTILLTGWPLAGCAPPPMAMPASCGDGVVDELAGEQCDDAGDSASCDRDCTLAECGDGYVNPVAGESCEDGNQVPNDGCRASCERERCGDGVRDPGERCDDGNQVSGDGCSADCRSDELCGNGTVDSGEACDDGNVTASDGCGPACQLEGCGNGAPDQGEACDDGNQVSGDGCSSDCHSDETCGNGIVDPGERCDDSNQVSGDGCSADCGSDEICGNGIVDPGERCDDGGQVSGDGCSADCGSDEICGNGIVDPAAGEACDDGGDTASCDSDCTPALCGDEHVNLTAGEQCDAGGDTASCDTDCTSAWCGDGTPNTAAGEECDDGNADDSDWCLPTCKARSCDDGIRNGDEQDVDCGGECGSCVEPMIVAGMFHTCALLQTGAVRCWGLGSSGQLGYGNTRNIGDNEAPRTAGNVDVGGDVVQLAAGAYHTCALLATGAVRCWGLGSSGQLGYGNTESIGDDEDETPATAGDVNVGGVVVQLAAGAQHTCALLETGAVRCWGSGLYGQLGYGNTNSIGDDETPATAGDVNVGGVVVQVVAGWERTCARLVAGAVRCWGSGGYGQLGYGNTNNIGDNEVPATVGNVNVGGFVTQLAAGAYHTCATLITGPVRCWGHGGYGQLGYGNTSTIGDSLWDFPFENVNVGEFVVELAAGHSHTCARLGADVVKCWGKGLHGQLGYGNTNNIGDNEVPATVAGVHLGGIVKQLAGGGEHTCAMLEGGAVRCWGYGAFGALGYGTTSNIGDDESAASAGDVPYR